MVRTGLLRALSVAVLLAGVLPGSTACTTGCTAILVYGLQVVVRDQRTGGPVENLSATLTDGDYREVVTPRDAGVPVVVVDSGLPRISVLTFAQERTGNFTLRISAPGYQPSGPHYVRVTGDVCHPYPVTLIIEMVPL